MTSTQSLTHLATGLCILTTLAGLPSCADSGSGNTGAGGDPGSGANGGASATGGASAAGGNPGAGGSAAAGGAVSTGGSPGLGGNAGTAGSGTVIFAGPPPVALGSASHYVLLAKTAIATVPTSTIVGDLGLSPAAASYITGFSLTKAGTQWTSPQVTGAVFAADNDPPTPLTLTTAIADMETAYVDAAGRSTPDHVELSGGAIGGLTLAPGLYKWTTTVSIPTDVTFSGAANDVWILQISGDLTMSAGKGMTLSGGAQAKNIVWQVAGNVAFEATSHAEGVVLAKAAIKLGTGAAIHGRLLSQTAINLDQSSVTPP